MSFYETAKELADSGNMGTARILCEKYGISLSLSSIRFKSLFGCTVREYVLKKYTPTKEECDFALATSDTVEEMRERLNLRQPHYWNGLLDRYYGVSTFSRAKATFLSRIPVEAYNPTLADNKAIFLSQVFGDGYYDVKRNAIRIEHGYKQKNYLLFKVGLFNKAWPTTNGIEKVTQRTASTGYVSYGWYSGKLPESYRTLEQRFSDLTPFGILLFYMDDGCYHAAPGGQHVVSLAISKPELQDEAVAYFASYGIKFNKSKDQITVQSMVGVADFLNTFVRPYAHLVPECMKYKCEMKV